MGVYPSGRNCSINARVSAIWGILVDASPIPRALLSFENTTCLIVNLVLKWAIYVVMSRSLTK